MTIRVKKHLPFLHCLLFQSTLDECVPRYIIDNAQLDWLWAKKQKNICKVWILSVNSILFSIEIRGHCAPRRIFCTVDGQFEWLPVLRVLRSSRRCWGVAGQGRSEPAWSNLRRKNDSIENFKKRNDITYGEFHTYNMTRKAKKFRLFLLNHDHLTKWTERERKSD